MRLIDIQDMPGYEFREGFVGVKSVSEGNVFSKYFPLAGGEYPACKKHGAILLVDKRPEGNIWRCRELGCDDGCFAPNYKESFQKGDRVKLARGHGMIERPSRQVGTIVGKGRSPDCITIKWDTLKTIESYHTKFIQKAEC